MATKDRTALKDEFKNGNLATGERFADLIDSMKVVQLPVVDPQALGTSLSFIDSISQDADGKITATKKTLDLANAHELNPFKGWYKTGDTLPTDGFDGAYLYFKDTSELTGQTTIYRWNGTAYADTGTVVDESNVQTFATGQAVNGVHIKDENGEEVTGPAGVLSAEAGAALKNTKMDKSYPIYETSPLTATDTQYQTGYYISYYGVIVSVSGFSVLGFDCTENQKLFITGSFGPGPSCLGVFQDDNGNVKGLVLQKPNPSPYNSTVVSDYYCEVPSGATKIYIQTKKTLLQNPSCKLITNTTYRQYSEIILQNEMDIVNIQADLEQLQDDLDESIYTELIITQTWVNRMVLSNPVVGETPNFVSNIEYKYCYIEGLKPGDVVNAHFRAGITYELGAKLKNGVIVGTFAQNQATLDRTYTVDDTFDAIILNDYIRYVPSPTAEVKTNGNRITVIENDITDLQETVNDIIEQGVGGEFNLLCFGNSFTQDTISYIPWLIKECEPNLKLNVYFTYMGGMPISQCLAYISNGTTIALNGSGTPTTKYENHGGWDRIYSYSNGEWVEPGSSETNYHKSYTLYKYEDGANGWVSQSEPTAASVLQMKNWDLITIQQGGSINFESWDYYFKPYVYKIQAELQKQVKHNFMLGYLMTHASYSTNAQTLLSYYNGIVQNATKMLENTPVEIVMPYATALQNARTTYLDRFGAGGHLMGDTAHVSDGVGCLTCAYANTMAILDLIGSKKSIVGSQIYPDAAWLNSHNIPAVSSTIEGLSRYNIWLAQQCAVMATKYPLQLTDMVAKGMCGDTEIEIVDDVVCSSNPILSANVGESWNTVLSAPDGYTISNVVMMMGGTDITATAYDSTTHAIDITNVSGKITITVTLVASA